MDITNLCSEILEISEDIHTENVAIKVANIITVILTKLNEKNSIIDDKNIEKIQEFIEENRETENQDLGERITFLECIIPIDEEHDGD